MYFLFQKQDQKQKEQKEEKIKQMVAQHSSEKADTTYNSNTTPISSGAETPQSVKGRY